MERIDAILEDPQYKNVIAEIKKLEKDRIYCKHDMDHLLNTARIAYIINLEEELNIPKEYIYATALLHDTGRYDEYVNGIEHDIAGGIFAVKILTKNGFRKDEIAIIKQAILEHREKNNDILINGVLEQNKDLDIQVNLSYAIRKADILSRPCFGCNAENTCKWSAEKKNFSIKY